MVGPIGLNGLSKKPRSFARKGVDAAGRVRCNAPTTTATSTARPGGSQNAGCVELLGCHGQERCDSRSTTPRTTRPTCGHFRRVIRTNQRFTSIRTVAYSSSPLTRGRQSSTGRPPLNIFERGRLRPQGGAITRSPTFSGAGPTATHPNGSHGATAGEDNRNPLYPSPECGPTLLLADRRPSPEAPHSCRADRFPRPSCL